ncbi:MAG: hypothetical protein O3C21_13725 [Verrucomicrobia bacterium]|nr:hypothetical protein [Verrucomicrobiota bacterium]
MSASPIYKFAAMPIGLLMAGGTGLWPAAGEPLPEFRLNDENVNSRRYGDQVSPAQYRQQISVWYFGSAT